MTRIALLALVGMLGLVSAGCGGDDDAESGASATVAWADDLCSAVTTWTDELQRVGSDLTDVSSFSMDRLREAGSEVEAATQAFVEDIRLLGTPDTESGDEVYESLDTLANTIDDQKREIEDAIADATGITSIASTVSTVAASLATMGQEFQRTFDQLDDLDASGELESAFDEADSCAELTAS